MKKITKQILSDIESIKKDIFILKQKICKHNRRQIVHHTEGHFRANEYVGGDIYDLECIDCGLKIGSICNRWDSKWSDDDIKKINSWKSKYKMVDL